MKKSALVFVDDFGHPKSTILPVVEQIFDKGGWNVCVVDRIDQIVDIVSAPDLIVSFKNSISEAPRGGRNWYQEAFTYKWPNFVNRDGCGLLIVHAGFAFIPKEHPVITEVMHGYFMGHPPLSAITIEPVADCKHPIMEGVTGFVSLMDEHFQVGGLTEENTDVLAYSSADDGRQPCVWAHESGNGRVAVILPGHANPDFQALRHPSMLRMLSNAVRWLGREV